MLGKLAASWGAALAFLAVSVPFLLVGLAYGGTVWWRALAALAALAVVLLVVCAFGLAMSALVSRTSGSAVLTYVVVAALSVGTLIAFGLSATFLSRTHEVQVYGYDWSTSSTWPDTGDSERTCTWRTETRTLVHTEYTAWLLGLNPFVIVADVAAEPMDDRLSDGDPLSWISTSVRWAQTAPATEIDECWNGDSWDEFGDRELSGSPYWPWSLAVYLVAGAGAVWWSARRIAVPAQKLPRGTRIA